jgi:DNA-binding transcriptional LysR family regulator
VHTLRGLVAAGLGVAVLPVAQVALPEGIVEIPLRPRASRRVGLIWAADRRLTPAVLTFRDFVISQAERGRRDSTTSGAEQLGDLREELPDAIGERERHP